MNYRQDLSDSLAEMVAELNAKADSRRAAIALQHLDTLSSESWVSLSKDEQMQKLERMKDDFYWRSWEPEDSDEGLYQRIVKLVDNYRYNLK